MNHVSETTFLHLINCVRELRKIVDRQRAMPGPLTHDEQVTIRKADEVRQVALREARLSGILPHGGEPNAPVD